MLKVSKNNTEYVHREQSWLHTWRPEAVSYNLNLLTSGILKSRLFLCEMPGIAVTTVGRSRPRPRQQRMRPRRHRTSTRRRHRLNGAAHRCILLVILFGLCRRKEQAGRPNGMEASFFTICEIVTDFAHPHFRIHISDFDRAHIYARDHTHIFAPACLCALKCARTLKYGFRKNEHFCPHFQSRSVLKKCSAGRRFICIDVTSYKIHTLTVCKFVIIIMHLNLHPMIIFQGGTCKSISC